MAILIANPDLMFMFDKNGVFVDFYSGVNVPLFVSPDFFLGKNISEVMPPYIVELTLHHLTKLFQTGQMQVFNYQTQEKSGLRLLNIINDHLLMTLNRNKTQKNQP